MGSVAFDANKAIKKMMDNGYEWSEAEGLIEVLADNGLSTNDHVALLIKESELRMQKFIFASFVTPAYGASQKT